MLPIGYGARTQKGRATYSAIGGPNGFLATCTPFAGNSMSARWEGEAFVVYSYATEIAVAHAAGDGVWCVFNDHHYSSTTSHHQGLAHAWLGYQLQVLPVPAAAAA